MKNEVGVAIVRGPDLNDKKHTVTCPLCGWKLNLMRRENLTSSAAELSIPHVEWVHMGADGENPHPDSWEEVYDTHVEGHGPAEWLHFIHGQEDKIATLESSMRHLNDFLDSFVKWLNTRAKRERQNISEALNNFADSDPRANSASLFPEQFKELR